MARDTVQAFMVLMMVKSDMFWILSKQMMWRVLRMAKAMVEHPVATQTGYQRRMEMARTQLYGSSPSHNLQKY